MVWAWACSLIEFEVTEETMLRGQVNVRGSLFWRYTLPYYCGNKLYNRKHVSKTFQ